jgi:membrane-anchored protein YejM (alkaline phosphatase superfamily)
VNWSLFDFVVAFILLSGLFFALRLMIKKAKSPRQRRIGVAMIVVLFVLIWGELAVGLFGTPFAGN